MFSSLAKLVRYRGLIQALVVRDLKARSWRFGHLSIDQRGAALREVLRVDHARLLELEPQVVALARAFAHAAEHRDTAVLHGDVVDQLHDDHGLADAGAAEQADLAALQVRLEQVDDLDAGLEHLQLGRLLFERRGRTVNRPAFLRHHGTIREVDRLAQHVQHAAEGFGTDRHQNRRARVDHTHAALQAVGRLHRNGAHAAFAQVLLDFGDDVDLLATRGAIVQDADGVVDGRQVPALVLDVDDGSDDLDDLADFLIARCNHSFSLLPGSGIRDS